MESERQIERYIYIYREREGEIDKYKILLWITCNYFSNCLRK